MKKVFIAALLLLVSTSGFARQPKFDRGLGDASNTFVPKGTLALGASMAYHHASVGEGDNGYEFLGLLTGVKGQMTTLNFSPAAFYFIAPNTAIGVRFGYDSKIFDIDRASLSLGESLNMDLSNHYAQSLGYAGTLAMRNYVPLFGSKIFAMYSEVRVGGTKTQSKAYSMDGNEKNGTFSDGYSVVFGVYPGLTAFVTNDLAIEVGVSMFECTYSYTKQTKNQSFTSSMSSQGTTFKPNILGVQFSVMYYIQVKR